MSNVHSPPPSYPLLHSMIIQVHAMILFYYFNYAKKIFTSQMGYRPDTQVKTLHVITNETLILYYKHKFSSILDFCCC